MVVEFGAIEADKQAKALQQANSFSALNKGNFDVVYASPRVNDGKNFEISQTDVCALCEHEKASFT